MTLQSLQPLTITKNVVNVHAEPNSDAELVTQAILGQPAWSVAYREGWIMVQLWDTYRGWVQSRSTRALDSGQAYPSSVPFGRIKPLIADVHKAPQHTADVLTKLVVTTEADLGEQRGAWTELQMPGGETGWVRSSDITVVQEPHQQPRTLNGESLLRQAKRFVGTPYLWGGATPFGLDCSGLVQLVYRLNGHRLLRDAHLQARDPRARPQDPQKLKKGDLVFFCGPEDTDRAGITHVGLYAGNGEFIHSSGLAGGVTVSPLFSGYFWDVFWGARTMDFSQ